MEKRKLKKLQLNKKTLRNLDDQRLMDAAGGSGEPATIYTLACSDCTKVCTECTLTCTVCNPCY